MAVNLIYDCLEKNAYQVDDFESAVAVSKIISTIDVFNQNSKCLAPNVERRN